MSFIEEKVNVYDTIAEISPEDWDRCAGQSVPYVLHSHFLALEKAGLLSESRGIKPRYVVLRDVADKVTGIAPGFMKLNSTGELGVDIGLPLAYERLGHPYYPKLVVETPFVPVEGPRLMINSGQPHETRLLLLRALQRIAKDEGAASVQILYGEQEDIDACQELGFHSIQSMTYNWIRGHSRDFEHWISTMHKRGRKRVRDEYFAPLSAGLHIETIPGSALPPEFSSWFVAQYFEAFARYSTDPWLNKDYFTEILVTMRHNIEFIAIRRFGKLLGGILCLASPSRLFAHHWVNQNAEKQDLFACYFHTIRLALVRGLELADFQPIGNHKAFRGIQAVPARHGIYFFSPEFREVASVIASARSASAQRDIDSMNAMLPFKHPTA